MSFDIDTSFLNATCAGEIRGADVDADSDAGPAPRLPQPECAGGRSLYDAVADRARSLLCVARSARSLFGGRSVPLMPTYVKDPGGIFPECNRTAGPAVCSTGEPEAEAAAPIPAPDEGGDSSSLLGGLRNLLGDAAGVFAGAFAALGGVLVSFPGGGGGGRFNTLDFLKRHVWEWSEITEQQRRGVIERFEGQLKKYGVDPRRLSMAEAGRHSTQFKIFASLEMAVADPKTGGFVASVKHPRVGYFPSILAPEASSAPAPRPPVTVDAEGARERMRIEAGRDQALRRTVITRAAIPEGMTDARFVVTRLAPVVSVAEQIGEAVRSGQAAGRYQNLNLHEKMRLAKALAHAEAAAPIDAQWSLRPTHSSARVPDLGTIYVYRKAAPMIVENLLVEYYALVEQLEKRGVKGDAAGMRAGQIMVARRLSEGYQPNVQHRSAPERLIAASSVTTDRGGMLDMRVGRTFQERIQDVARQHNAGQPRVGSGSGSRSRPSTRATAPGQNNVTDLARHRAKFRLRPKGR